MLKSRLEETCDKLQVGIESLAGVSVLMLPEHIDSSSGESLFDTESAISLAKHFKSQGVCCKTAYDLGARPKVLDRRGLDVWLGVVWVLENLTAPTVVGVLTAWIIAKYQRGSGDKIGPSNGPPTMHLDLRLQDRDRLSTLKFDGSATDLVAVLRGLQQNERINDGTQRES